MLAWPWWWCRLLCRLWLLWCRLWWWQCLSYGRHHHHHHQHRCVWTSRLWDRAGSLRLLAINYQVESIYGRGGQPSIVEQNCTDDTEWSSPIVGPGGNSWYRGTVKFSDRAGISRCFCLMAPPRPQCSHRKHDCQPDELCQVRGGWVPTQNTRAR